MKGRLLGGVLALCVLFLAGCSDDSASSEENRVRTAITEFGKAAAAKEYHRICTHFLAAGLVSKVESVGLPCEAALRAGLGEVRNPTTTVGRIVVSGERATAEVKTSATGQAPSLDVLHLIKEAGQWRISSLQGALAGG